jgi:diacylglycerol O-acyltransferase/trehalose O-mycolyltransferase
MLTRRDLCRAGLVTAGAATTTTGLFAGAAEAGAGGAVVVGQKWLSKRLLEFKVSSPAMGRTLTNRLLVPRGWSASAKRTWPVIFMLHGGNDTYVSWTRSTDIEAFTAKTRALIVMPECGRSGGFTDWWYGGKGGRPRWETYHLTEIRRIVERRYRGGTHRAVAGLSAGGYGALIYAARHPHLFAYAAAYSPYAATMLPGIPEGMLAGMQHDGLNGLDMWGPPWWSPNVWPAHDPVTQAPHLKGTRLYLSCSTTGLDGPFDKPGQEYGTRNSAEQLAWTTVAAFSLRLQQLGIPATRHFYPTGTHSWPYWKREMHRSWPLLTKAIGA